MYLGKKRTPLEAMKAFCNWCMSGTAHDCDSVKCALHPYKGGEIPPKASRNLLKQIKARCLDCMPNGAESCDAFEPYEFHKPCPLWPYRLGKSPNVSEATRQKRSEQAKKQGLGKAQDGKTGAILAS